MKSTLKPHQVIGTAFMLNQEKKGKGGILADQMGLGKTVTTLALINKKTAKRASHPGPTLVVAPKAVNRQWLDEIYKHCETGGVTHGIARCKIFKASTEKENITPDNPPERLLQDFDIVITTYKQVEMSFPSDEPPPGLSDAQKQLWRERNFEKNKGILHHTKFHRIVLDEAHEVRNPETATYQAVKALRFKYCWSLTGTPFYNGLFDVYNLLDLSGVDVGMPYGVFESKYWDIPSGKDARIYLDLLRLSMVRRTHRSLLFGARLVTLPKTNAVVFRLHFTPVERAIYDIIEKRFREKMTELLLAGEEREARKYALIVLLRLRQLTAHPLVLHTKMLDLLERRDLIELQEIIQKERKQLRDKNALIAANQCVECKGEAKKPQITSCMHILCKECLTDIQDEAASASLGRAKCPTCKEVFESVEAQAAESEYKPNLSKKKKAQVNSLEIDLKDLLGVDGKVIPSTKTYALKARIMLYRRNEPDVKIIVFTQWLGMIRILESICEAEEWKCIKYHGHMTAIQRHDAVEQFGKDKSICIMLCSLQAGGVGINLTMASRVICVDHWWNNAVEEQAFSRCYRIGQTRETSMLQLCIIKTIDERMMAIKKRKQDSINRVAGSGEDSNNKLTKDDLLALLGIPKSAVNRQSRARNDVDEESE
ncbi:SNF2 family N-terminal domain-containing protein [Elsinoe ampelina]|uniref:SNF2 family N-terminal domain-containing protein n=1 Tax=Elsinoe ampelina TaxID=302913 RepID=A0A6A6G5S3_9PEZI|nr:SNF2 family N-terminal domain-containing protein [Elsinoe ampelina]